MTRFGGVGNFCAPSCAVLRASLVRTMNNSQFRRLLLSDQPQQHDGSKAGPPPASRTPGAALGARKHSSMPMTPYVAAATVDVAAF